jgi:hypothetical protein
MSGLGVILYFQSYNLNFDILDFDKKIWSMTQLTKQFLEAAILVCPWQHEFIYDKFCFWTQSIYNATRSLARFKS